MATDRAKKISDLTTLAANAVANGDLFVVVDVSAGETKKVLANNMAQYFVGLVNKGEKGELGTTGSKGDKGEKGGQGDKGDLGSTGSTGATGAKGEKGERYISATYTDANNTLEFGSSDASSNVYVTGIKGQKGDLGSKGEVGSKGDKGDLGSQGNKGDTGSAATDNVLFSGSIIYEANGDTIQIGPGIMGVNFIQVTGQSEVNPTVRIAGSAKNGSNGGVQIETGNNGADYIWKFGANGQLSFPDTTLQSTAFKGSFVKPTTITSNTYAANGNPSAADVLLVDLNAVGSNCTLTLPNTGITEGRFYTVKIINNSGHILNITSGGGANSIEDPATGTLQITYSMNNLGQSHTWFYDASGVYRHIV